MTEQVGWVATRCGAVFVGFTPAAAPARATTVVLVPPFGWEAVASYRLLRAWSRDLAADGYATLRFHPPGSGDSEGVGLEQDLDSWTRALSDVADIARSASGAPHLTAVGLGLGGQVVLNAVSAGARIDEAVLWATPSRGRALLREMRTFATPSPTSGPGTGNDALWVHGYPLTARAQEQVHDWDAAALSLSGLQRALVLGRGTLPVDAKLVAALESSGVVVEVAQGPGYDELTHEPRLARPATETQAAVLRWLSSESGAPLPVPAPVPWHAFREQHLELAGADVVLTPSEGVAAVTAVFIGAGSQARSGPNRFWTDAARTWASWGVASLRLDLHGIGDAPGPDVFPHGPEGYHDALYSDQVLQVLDAAAGLGLPSRFLLVGLSSGGYWSGRHALADDRVVGAIILNPGTLVPLPLLAAGTRGYLLSRETWQRFLADPYLRREAYARVRRSLAGAFQRVLVRQEQQPLTSLQLLEALVRRKVLTTVVLSTDECATERLDRLAPNPFVQVRQIHGPSGAHTLSPAELRAQAAQIMDESARAVVRAVASADAAATAGGQVLRSPST